MPSRSAAPATDNNNPVPLSLPEARKKGGIAALDGDRLFARDRPAGHIGSLRTQARRSGLRGGIVSAMNCRWTSDRKQPKIQSPPWPSL